MFELWHKSFVGSVVAVGFLERGTEERLRALAKREYAPRPGEATHTLHLVKAGSYEGFQQPDLGHTNMV